MSTWLICRRTAGCSHFARITRTRTSVTYPWRSSQQFQLSSLEPVSANILKRRLDVHPYFIYSSSEQVGKCPEWREMTHAGPITRDLQAHSAVGMHDHYLSTNHQFAISPSSPVANRSLGKPSLVKCDPTGANPVGQRALSQATNRQHRRRRNANSGGGKMAMWIESSST